MKAALIATLLMAALKCHAQWNVVAGGFEFGQVHALHYVPDSQQLYLGGTVQEMAVGPIEVNGIGYYEGGAWHAMDGGVSVILPGLVDPVRAICPWSNSIIVAGSFRRISDTDSTTYAAEWRNGVWYSMGLDSSFLEEGSLIRTLKELDGYPHLLGWFDWMVQGTAIHSWATWNGMHWIPGDSNGLFPEGYTGARQINQAVDYNGQRYVGGNMDGSGGAADDLMVLSDNTWQMVGTGIQGDAWVNDLEVYDGKLWVVGEFYGSAGNPSTGIMTWDGSQWSDPFPQIALTAAGRELLVADGKLYFVGPFVGQGLSGQYRIAVFDGEQLCVIGGHLIQASSIAASADTLYGFVYPEGWPMQQVAMWPLDAPADTCYTIVQGIASAEGPVFALEVFPNPANGSATVRWSNGVLHDGFLHIVDASGRTLITERVRQSQGETTIGLQSLLGGFYRVVLRTADGGIVAARPLVKLD